MRTRTITLMLIVAACLSCGGNNPVPTIGMTHSGTDADAILSTKNEPQSTIVTKTVRNQHAYNRSKLGDNDIIPKDDFEVEGIVSPAEELDVPKEKYRLDAGSGGNFIYEKTGSTVSIPPDALVDKNGQPVTGKVDISYREFHTQKEIFFSGIPMDFDVNGEKQYFESAGMIDISASQNGEEIFVKKGSEISFSMSTDNRNENVKLYELDKKTKKWSELGEAPVVINARKNKKIWGPVYSNQMIDERERMPFHISIIDYLTKYSVEDREYKRKIRFRIHMPKINSMKNKQNQNVFKHANWLNNAVFEVAGYKRMQFKKILDQFKKLKRADEPFRYKEILADVTIKDVNYPFMTMEFTYEGKKAEFEVQLYHKYGISNKSKKKIFDAIANFPINNFDGRHTIHKENVYCIERYDSIYPTGSEEWINKSIVQREFQAKNFGILNCDQPKALPREMIAQASFFNDEGEFFPSSVVLTDFGRNVMFTYYSGYYNQFGYNPDVKNFIFAVDGGGTVSYILPEELEALQDKNDLKLHMHQIPIENFGKVMEELFPTKTEYSYTL